MYKKVLIIITPLIILMPVLLFIVYSAKPASSLGSDQGPYIDSANVNTYEGSNAVFALLRVGDIEYLGGAFGLEALDTTTGQKIDWDSGLTNATVYALAYKNNTLYAGANNGLLAYDTSTNAGTLITDFVNNNQTFQTESPGPVYALAIDGNTLYVGGYFTSFINGGIDTSLAAYNIASPPGTLSGVDLNTSGSSVYALATGSGKLYVGGNFSAIKGHNQSILAAVDTTGPELPQDLRYHTSVTTTIGGTNYIYVLGGWSDLGGNFQSTVYKATIDSSGDIGTFDTTNQGQLPQTLAYHTSVTTTIGGTNYIYVLGGWDGSSVKSTVYKATIDSNGDIGTFDTTNQGQLPQTLNSHTAVASTIGGTTYVYVLGGCGDSICPESTVYKATIDGSGDIGAFDTTNQGQLPQAFDDHTTVTSTIAGTTYIYILGGQNNSWPDTQSTVYKATIDPITGNVGAFDTTNQSQLPQVLIAHTTVTAAIGGTNYVYVLGGYDWGNNQSTVYKATIDGSGDVGAFDTTSQGQLPQTLENHTTVVSDTNGTSYIYVLGGSGDNRLGQAAIYKASITTNGNVGTFTGKFALDTSFAPSVTGQSPNVTALKFYNNKLYTGGSFTTINGNTYFDNLASLDPATGVPDSWTPITNDPVFALTAIGNYLYVGEADNFQGSGLGGSAQNFNLDTGSLANWTPSDTQPIYAMDAGDSALYVGLDKINTIGRLKQENNASFAWLPHFPVAEAAGKFLADIGGLTAPIYLAEFDTIVPTPTDTPTPTSTPTPAPSSGSTSASAPVCGAQKPSAPSNLTTTQGADKTQVVLTWTASLPPVTDYSITYSNNPNTPLWGVVSTGNVTTYTISNLDPTVKYYFWVNPVNGCMPGDAIGPASLGGGAVSALMSGNSLTASGSSIATQGVNPLPVTGSNDIIKFGSIGIMLAIIGATLLLTL